MESVSWGKENIRQGRIKPLIRLGAECLTGVIRRKEENCINRMTAVLYVRNGWTSRILLNFSIVI